MSEISNNYANKIKFEGRDNILLSVIVPCFNEIKTIKEVIRGYTGDRSAPERLSLSSKVIAGPVIITGTRRVQMFGGLIDYENAWKEEHGYQRPLELATVRLRNMVEVLSNWKVYDSKFIFRSSIRS